MQAPPPLPPGTGSPPAPLALPPDARPAAWRSALMAAILAAYVLVSGLSGEHRAGDAPLLPADTRALLMAVGINGVLFLAVALLAFGIGRPGLRELHADRRPGWLNVVLGFAWSIALRLGLAAGLLGLLGIIAVVKGAGTDDALQDFRPKVENLIDPGALSDPVYLGLMLTVVSFGLAGLREELWRAGMIAALARLFPVRWSRRRSELIAMVVAAGIFGLGHLTQGWAGVGLTAVLGIGLGAILVLRRSLAEAVLAHGFFDATTFVFLAVLANRPLLERLGLDPTLLDQLLGK